MNRLLASAVMCLTCVGLGSLPACEKSRDEMRPDMDKVYTENGLQSRDLREMTDKLAPQILAIPTISQSPTKITVVVKGVHNSMEGEQTRDVDIFVARLAGLLAQHANDRIAFIEENARVGAMAAQELGNSDPFEAGSRTPPGPSAAIQPQFALYGDFRSMRGSKNTYYLCQFKLTNLTTKQEYIFQHEVLTLNIQ